MAEYIEREEAIQFVKQNTPHINGETTMQCVERSLMNVPAADVVEVVRCKDCAFAKNNYLVNGLCLCEKTIYDHIKGEIPRNTLMEENDYCSFGERRCEE